MIATPHHHASRIGLDVLRSGGNAVDAAVAASAALMVAVPMQCSPGGDAIWLIRTPQGEVTSLDASGRSAEGADAAALRQKGILSIQPRSAMAVTVPGVVAGWVEALSRYGSRPLAGLLEPAAAIAEEGIFVSRHLAASFLVALPTLQRWGALSLWSSDGRPPALYQRLHQPKLAAALRAIGATGGDIVYQGELGRAIVTAVQSRGGWLTTRDLQHYRAEWAAPLKARLRGLDLWTSPPATQGVALAVACELVEALAPADFNPDDASGAHLMIEAASVALAERDRVLADPQHMVESAADLLAADHIHMLAARIDTARANVPQMCSTSVITRGDTAHIAVVDAERRAVSLIQSLFLDFGSGIPVEEWGFTLQNRGAAFSLDAAAPNRLMPGVHPPHTLAPSLAVEGERLAAVLGCMGGDGQIQTQLQLLASLQANGLDAQQAVSKPRWYVDRRNSRVLVEAGFSAEFVESLTRRGHAVQVLGVSEEIMGHAELITLHPGAAMAGAADPRSDGQAAGW
jgi:gamma-glutamyltranspeptidase/glutathione hydrolase